MPLKLLPPSGSDQLVFSFHKTSSARVLMVWNTCVCAFRYLNKNKRRKRLWQGAMVHLAVFFFFLGGGGEVRGLSTLPNPVRVDNRL